MLRGHAYIDGEFCPIGEARIPLLDWGFIKSDATYDVVAVWRGAFFRLEDHLDRFERSIAALRMTLPVSRQQLRRILAHCVTDAGLDNAYVSMTLTRGVPGPGCRDPRRFENRLYCYAIDYMHVFDADAKGRGAHLVTAARERIDPAAVDPRVKNYHWLDLVMSLFDAYDRGGDLPVLLDRNGNVTEGAGYNLFAVIAGEVVTPHSGVLEGITRQTVLDICAELGIAARVCDVPAPALADADEMFMSTTAGGIMPVATFDGRPVGSNDNIMGPVTERICHHYWRWHEDPRFTTPVSPLVNTDASLAS